MTDRRHRLIGGPSWHRCGKCGTTYRKAGAHEWHVDRCRLCRTRSSLRDDPTSDRCEVRRSWTGWRCVLPAEHEGHHVDWKQAGKEAPEEGDL